MLLFDGGDAPLKAFGPKLSGKAADSLQATRRRAAHGVPGSRRSTRAGCRSPRRGQDVRYDARTVLWTAGVEAPSVAARIAEATGAEHDRAGRIAVRPDCTIEGHPEIFVVGDVMTLNGMPGLAEVAMQTGAYAGRHIRHQVEGATSFAPFSYLDLGSAAYLSRGRAVVAAGPLHLAGRLGWLVWLFIHIAFLTGYRNRFTAIMTWLVAFSRGIRRERAFITQPVDTRRDVYRSGRVPDPAGPDRVAQAAVGRVVPLDQERAPVGSDDPHELVVQLRVALALGGGGEASSAADVARPGRGRSRSRATRSRRGGASRSHRLLCLVH